MFLVLLHRLLFSKAFECVSINTLYSVSPTRIGLVAHLTKAMYCGSVGRGIQSSVGILFFSFFLGEFQVEYSLIWHQLSR